MIIGDLRKLVNETRDLPDDVPVMINVPLGDGASTMNIAVATAYLVVDDEPVDTTTVWPMSPEVDLAIEIQPDWIGLIDWSNRHLAVVRPSFLDRHMRQALGRKNA